MSKKEFFMAVCDFCGQKNKIYQLDDLKNRVFVPTAEIQSNIPIYDPLQKKTIISKNIARRKIIKCEKCGRAMVLRNDNVPKSEVKDNSNAKNNNTGCETSPFGQ